MGGKSTATYYKENAYTWQTNTDDLWAYAWSVIFTRALERVGDGTDTLLDIGCGRGKCLEYYNGPYHGIDISHDNIAAAKKAYPKATFEIMDATKTTFVDNTFKRIVCIETIEHLTIEQLEALLQEMHRVSAPGCTIVITTPNLYYLWGLIPWSFFPLKRRLPFTKFFSGVKTGYVDENYNLPVHHYRWRPSFLKTMFEQYFTVTRVESTYWYNNRAVHGLWPTLQMKFLKFSARYRFFWLNAGSQLVITMVKKKKNVTS